MKDAIETIPESSKPRGFIQATLTIPEHAVRVIAAPPETLTQRNVEAVTGLSPRAYLEVIREPTFPLRVSQLGKLRIVNRAAFVAWLESRQGQMNPVLSERDEIEEKASTTTARNILDRIGLERRREPPKRRVGIKKARR